MPVEAISPTKDSNVAARIGQRIPRAAPSSAAISCCEYRYGAWRCVPVRASRSVGGISVL
jgi:hypothetical protein